MSGWKKRRDWDVHVTRMDVERSTKISKDNKLPKDLQGARKEDGVTYFSIKTGGFAYNKGEEEDI